MHGTLGLCTQHISTELREQRAESRAHYMHCTSPLSPRVERTQGLHKWRMGCAEASLRLSTLPLCPPLHPLLSPHALTTLRVRMSDICTYASAEYSASHAFALHSTAHTLWPGLRACTSAQSRAVRIH